jgi:hypothetical protein
MYSPSFGRSFLLVSHSLFDEFKVSNSLFDQFRGEVPEHCVVSLVISCLPANLKPLFCIKRYAGTKGLWSKIEQKEMLVYKA